MDKFGRIGTISAVSPATTAEARRHRPPLRLTRGGPLPLHLQISEELRRQVSAGELHPGDLLPSEGGLMERFGVSRGTIRQALAALRSDGTIAGSRGRPPVVRGPRLAQPFSELLSFSAWISSLGMRPTGVVIEFARRPADRETAEALVIRPGAPVHHLVRLRCADDEPLMIERTTFAPRVGELVSMLDLEGGSIYEQLGRRGIVFDSARQQIDAVPASGQDAALLHVTPRTPLLRVRRNAFSPTGEPLEWSDDRYLADRIAFTIDNTASDASVVRRLGRGRGR